MIGTPIMLIRRGSARPGGLHEDDLADGQHEAAADPLQDAEDDERLDVPREAAQERPEREEHERRHVDASCTEAVGGPARDGQHGGDGEQVAGHHPLDLVERGGEVLGERLQRDVDDRRVEHRHDRAEDHDDRDALDVGWDDDGIGRGCGGGRGVHADGAVLS
jgi:hypothetical protein